MVPNSERKCRDSLCCIIFALFWVGMVVIAGIAFNHGNPKRLLYGTDYNGEVCNVGINKGLKYITYPRSAEDFFVNQGKSFRSMKVRCACGAHPGLSHIPSLLSVFIKMIGSGWSCPRSKVLPVLGWPPILSCGHSWASLWAFGSASLMLSIIGGY
jgi:hypothetical protein